MEPVVARTRSALAEQLATLLCTDVLNEDDGRPPDLRVAAELAAVVEVLLAAGWAPPGPVAGSSDGDPARRGLDRAVADERVEAAEDTAADRARTLTSVEDATDVVARTRAGRAAVPGPPSLARAIAYMQREAREPLTVGQVASSVGVSSRALQHSFARHLGTSPQGYLHDCRLDGARAELQAARPGTVTVRQVAAGWQFSNAGRFAADYRRRFGEPPSTTLRS